MNTISTSANQAPKDRKHASAARGDRALPAGDRARETQRSDIAAADIFAQALIDDSNHELDWLWAASQMTDVVQRRYCLERALAINADSELAREELQRLAASSAKK
ncbi:MAG TPA: hypothetical protein VKE41_03870 [Roseiflexaceae bacterium]|nr:hypothetical protein [Roseiflexaceae bacterium]